MNISHNRPIGYVIFLVLSSCLCLASMPPDIQIETGENRPKFNFTDPFLWYLAPDNTAVITATDPSATAVTIPAELNGHPVAHIGYIPLINGEIDTQINFEQALSGDINRIDVDPGNRYFTSVDGVLYNKDKSVIYRYPPKRNNASFVIPDSVTVIHHKAFNNNKTLQSITLPKTLTHIGMEAFEDCKSITFLALPSTVQFIDRMAFENCHGLRKLILPRNLNYLGPLAFKHCSALTTITVDSQNKNFTVRNQVLYSKDMKTLHVYPEIKKDNAFTIPQGVEIIAEAAFAYSQCTAVTFPQGVKRIETQAFYEAELSHVSFPASLTYLGPEAFLFAKIPGKEQVLFAGPIPEGADEAFDFFINDYTNPADFNVDVTGPTECIITQYRGSDSNVSVMPKNYGKTVVQIQDTAFADHWNLNSVKLPKAIRRIGNYAFADCQNLSTINLPENLQELGDGAFYHCALTSVTLPKKLHTIGFDAFNSCPLTSMDVDPLNQHFKSVDGVLFSKDGSKLLAYPPCKSGSTYVIPDTVTDITTDAFQKASLLERIAFPAAIPNVSPDTFLSCPNLHTMSFKCSPENLPQNGSFIPDTVKTIAVPDIHQQAWQQRYPQKAIQIIYNPNDYSFQIQGPTHLHANDMAFFKVQVQHLGANIAQEVAWSLENAPAGWMLTQDGCLKTGTLREPVSFFIKTSFKLPDGQTATGAKQLNAVTPGSSATTLSIYPGWNLVATTFFLDDTSQKTILDMHPFGYDRVRKHYMQMQNIEPGVPFWIYSKKSLHINLTGHPDSTHNL